MTINYQDSNQNFKVLIYFPKAVKETFNFLKLRVELAQFMCSTDYDDDERMEISGLSEKMKLNTI